MSWPARSTLPAAAPFWLTASLATGLAPGGDEVVVPAGEQERMLEADWLDPATLRTLVGLPSELTTRSDAAGGCDGVKDGRWGFHTAVQPEPWWQVDLERAVPLERVVVFNRCDSGMGVRAARLRLLTSLDGRVWEERYRHDGGVFGGAPDGRPLSVQLDGVAARFVRLQLPGGDPLHLDEVEVYGTAQPARNLALGRPADQSSLCEWSTPSAWVSPAAGLEAALRTGRELAAERRREGVAVEAQLAALQALEERAAATPEEQRTALYLEARRVLRRLTFADPLLDFDDLLFVKRVPGSYSHMSDQYYGWWSRPGGGVYVLRDFKGPAPRLECLTEDLPAGSFLRPDLSPDGRRVLFAYARHHPGLSAVPDKVAKDELPEDGFYHLFEVGVDGRGLRQLTRGRYDDFDARYLPSGEVVFLSTRRGQAFQVNRLSAARTLEATQPDSYVRCGGDAYRPVAVYTLHVMDADGADLRPISAFEMFEWTPAVAHDGSILYSRWDYVDRDPMPFMGLWATRPDGTGTRLVYGNHTHRPHCTFEPRPVPGSRRIVVTASAHHSITGGSLVLVDPAKAREGEAALERLTPEVCFPEIESWPLTYYANPWPLSERTHLVAWSNVPLAREGRPNPPAALGLYVFDALGHLELVHRDPALSSMYPIPLRARQPEPVAAPVADWSGPEEGTLLVQDVHRGLAGVPPGTVRRLRVVGVPAKTRPEMNQPELGVTRDDPGKCVLGTVPVEADGSAYFRVPSGVALFLQALDEDGLVVQTMRSAAYVQPGETLACVGCHEPRASAPPVGSGVPLAWRREPSRIRVGPEGSWPVRFDRLVQPVLDRACAGCHRPGAEDAAAARTDLSAPEPAYRALVAFGRPSLADQVLQRYREGASVAGACMASESALLALLRDPRGHHGVRLEPADLERLVTWMDTYAQRRGAFSAEQERELEALRARWAALLEEAPTPPRGDG